MRPRTPAIAAGARLLGVLAIGVGVVYLAAWFTGSAAAWSAAGAVTMKTNAALGLVLAGIALLAVDGDQVPGRRRAAGVASAAVVLAIGALTLAEHLLRVDLGIDQLLASETPGAAATASPNRMGPPAATSFLLLGAGLLALAWRRGVALHLGIATCVIVLGPAVGYLYGIGRFYGGHATGIASPTVVALLAMGMGVALASSRARGVLLWRDDPGGALLRKLAVPAAATPLALGWVAVQGARRGLYDTATGTGLFAMSLIVVFGFMLWGAAAQLSAASAERERQEEALREADRRKDEFLGVLSHELRNPLAPIRNGIFVLERAPADGEAARQAKEIIRRQTEHLSRLVDDLLDLTRIERGKIQLQLAPLDLSALVRRVCDDHRGMLQAKGLALSVECAEGAWIDGDATRVAQVVGNLLHNAAKFSDGGGAVSVVVRRVDGRAEIRVRDRGIGIAPELLERLFHPFVQGDRDLARTRGGLGLGLALVRTIAELHGGTAEAFSEGPGRGSELVVRFPLVPPPPGT